MHARFLFKLADIGKLLNHLFDQLESFLHVRVFSTTEDDRKDHFVFVLEEMASLIHLGLKVVFANFWTEAKFLVSAVMGMATVLPLLLLILELAVVHDPAYRRLFLRCHLNQIETTFARLCQGLVGGNDTKLGAVLTDQSNRSYADLVVDPLMFAFDG